MKAVVFLRCSSTHFTSLASIILISRHAELQNLIDQSTLYKPLYIEILCLALETNDPAELLSCPADGHWQLPLQAVQVTQDNSGMLVWMSLLRSPI